MVDLTNKTIDRYKIIDRLGTGGMAVVYKARDTRLEREIALKIIRTEMFPPALLQTALRRFEREAIALARISHPNIVSIFDYGEHENAPYLVMEYLPGGTLKDKLGQPVPFQQAAAYLAPVAQALAYAHSENIIHRDVKPANILFTQQGTPKLSDFGIVKLFDLEESVALTGSSMAIGTPAYMAPEQWSGNTSPVSDVYALGVVFYELLTGKPPYQSDTPGGMLTQILTQPLPDARSVVPSLPEEVSFTLQRVLAKTPHERLGSMDEFAQILAGLVSQVERPSPPVQADLPTILEPVEIPSGETLQAERPVRQVLINREPEPKRPELASRMKPPLIRRNLVLWASIAVVAIASILGIVFLGRPYLGRQLSNPPEAAAFQTTPSALETGSLLPTLTPTAPLIATRTQPPATQTSAPQPTLTPTQTVEPIQSLIKGSTQVSPIDEMILLYIPAGEFMLGAVSVDARAQEDEKPQHTVRLDGFWIDQHEVSKEMFAFCVEAGDCLQPVDYYNRAINLRDNPNDAVTNVTWENATAYCEWADRRLPTEAEWEKAARGGLEAMIYPWGNQAPVCDFVASNGANSKCYYQLSESVEMMRFQPNGYNLYDMAGNVWEWVSSLYKPYPYDPLDGREDSNIEGIRVLRGGSVYLGGDDDARVSNRYYHHQKTFDYASIPASFVGFRCAASP